MFCKGKVFFYFINYFLWLVVLCGLARNNTTALPGILSVNLVVDYHIRDRVQVRKIVQQVFKKFKSLLGRRFIVIEVLSEGAVSCPYCISHSSECIIFIEIYFFTDLEDLLLVSFSKMLLRCTIL